MNIDEMPISRVEWRPVDGLTANDYNPNVVYSSEMQLLKFSLMRQGWIQPILVTDEGVIIDGFHRATLAKADKEVRALTKGRVPCVVMKLTEAERMLLTIRINRAKGSHIALKMADIVHKLVNDMGVPIMVTGPMPTRPSSRLTMPVVSSRPTQARVRSRKLMHMGSITSMYRIFWVTGFLWAI